MRYLIVYFSSVIANDVVTYIYTTRKALKCTLKVGDTSDTFGLTYWDGKPKEQSVSSKGSYSLWLTRFNPDTQKREALSRDEAMLYAQHFGKEAVLELDADGNSQLIPLSDFQALPKDEQNVITADQLNASA